MENPTSPMVPSTVMRYLLPFMSGSRLTSIPHSSPFSTPPNPVTIRFSAETSPRTLAVTPAVTTRPATGIVSVASSRVLVLAAHVTAFVDSSRVHPKNSMTMCCSSIPMDTRNPRAASENTDSTADSSHSLSSARGPITAS